MSEHQSEKQQVAAVILYRDGAVLLQHRDDRPDIASPGAWAIFGGFMEPGETPEEAALREMEEELGLRLHGPLTLVRRHEDASRVRFFFAAALAVPPGELTLHEGQGMALLGPEEIDQYPVVPLHREILREFWER